MQLTLGYSHPRLAFDEEALRLVRMHSIRHVELRINDINRGGAMYNSTIRRDLCDLRENEGVSLSLHAFPGINLAEKVGRLRDVCIDLHREQVEFCEAVGARYLCLHVGTCGFDQVPVLKAARLELAMNSLRRVIETTKGSSVGLGIENVERLHPGLKKSYLADSLPELLAILDAQDDRLRAVFDTGHANINPERDSAELLAGLGRLWSVHIHANGGKRDEHSILTQGWVDARPQLFAALARLSRDGTPLIAEHYSVDEAAATLEVLARLPPAP